MGRYKKYLDAEKVISAFYASISDAYNHPCAGEGNQGGKKSINLLAEEFGISRLKVRKILITTGDGREISRVLHPLVVAEGEESRSDVGAGGQE